MENILHRNQSFRVPGNFAEFYAQYPLHVRKFVRRNMKGRPIQEQQDRESELLIFLLDLPADSKHRKPGANGHPEGCTDPIMTFKSEASNGSSAQHFLGYINYLLRNCFLNIEAKQQSNPVTRRGSLRLIDGESPSNSDVPDPNEISVDRLVSLTGTCSLGMNDTPAGSTMVSRFRAFVERHNRELLPVLECFFASRKFAYVRDELGIDYRRFSQARSRLQVLYRCFATGTPVPKLNRRPRYWEVMHDLRA